MSASLSARNPSLLPAQPATQYVRRPQLWAIGSALLLAASFPKLDLGWLAWIALVPFLQLFPLRRMRTAVGTGFALGFAFFALLWYWMAIFAGHVIGRPLGLVVWLGAALTESIFYAIFAAGAQWLSGMPGRWAWRLGAPALWVVLEWVRQFGALGTSWGELAYTQHAILPLLQMTKWAGVFGLGFLIVAVNVALSDLWKSPSPSAKRGAGAIAVIFAAVWLSGEIILHTEQLRPSFVAAALQADINENTPWTPQYAADTMRSFGALAHTASLRGAKLVVWPETAFPGYLVGDPALESQASAMAAQNNEDMLIGAIDYDYAARKNANALLLMNASGQVAGSYWKQKLVPFGEYIPFRKQFPFLSRLHLSVFDMQPGGDQQPLINAGSPIGKIGAAICYDSTDNELMRRETSGGANLLVVSTDDTWFGHTAAAAQHAAFAAVRATEDDRYLIRCAATGISEAISPNGKILASAGLFRRAVVAAPVEARHDIDPYVRRGDWAIDMSLLILICCAAHDLFTRRRNSARRR